ncbi:MAG: hypothetical protein MJK15_03845 [Colwellia sp.]|nr:hypothetical protein [Colwellia sp.]
MDIFEAMDNVNTRPSKLGWCKGGYLCECRSCGHGFTGAKGSYHCSDCAYNFTEMLEYEDLWKWVGMADTYKYICRKYNLFKGDK